MKRDPEFVRQHRQDNVRELALQASRYPDIDMPWALQQIYGWQMALDKLANWAACDNIEYPPHLNMEQCSSENTARYKAEVAHSLMPKGGVLVDLTGGMGVDFVAMARHFDRYIYVEPNEELCRLARKNFPALGIEHPKVVCSTAEDWLQQPTITDFNKYSSPEGGGREGAFIFLDPSRRDENGRRTYAIADCRPNLLALKDQLLSLADVVMVKLSPMLDWHLAVQQLDGGGRCVAEVHIVAEDNDCKELLLVLKKSPQEPLVLYCKNNQNSVCFHPTRPSPHLAPRTSHLAPRYSGSYQYLYEPNAAIMKGGCFAEFAEQYGLVQAAEHSHLFFSQQLINDFPGRSMLIERQFSLNKKAASEALRGLNSANITVRNFPLTAQQLRARLRLKDGGAHYIFATTLSTGEKALFLCQKIIGV